MATTPVHCQNIWFQPGDLSFWSAAEESASCISLFHLHYVAPRNEDPFIWEDPNGYLHMLLHNMVPCSEPEYSKGPGVGCGGHAYSKDGTQWIFSDVAAYTGQVCTPNSTSTNNCAKSTFCNTSSRVCMMHLLCGLMDGSDKCWRCGAFRGFRHECRKSGYCFC